VILVRTQTCLRLRQVFHGTALTLRCSFPSTVFCAAPLVVVGQSIAAWVGAPCFASTVCTWYIVDNVDDCKNEPNDRAILTVS
jgi:hypothetical protein